ncbi:carboxymethylenebutenolidase [Alicyclobacillus contaminans]|uniref:dienelactone hydrolase family protein n=1 Tax=Alicyclobacillus contaminans TaxID=392016 RepID=UPI0003F8F9F8|nr:dienelactone hydrolase family protein [Alicyclobacillus contaminans]GMA49987.1 carboxymethylenebutenolidase [Alicyclobacillus contaminans]
MGLKTGWIRYGSDNQYLGYLAAPEGTREPLPAVVVIQEIWGVDEHIQDITRRFAQAGYVALAPDLYAKDGQRPEALRADRIAAVKTFLDSVPPTAWHSEEERNAALAKLPQPRQSEIRETFGALFGGLKMDLYIDQVKATSGHLRDTYEGSKGQPVGSVGFCMGGALSGLLACEDPALSAAAIFYGNAPQPEAIERIQCPVMGFYGELDPRITDAVPGFAENMKRAGKSFEYHVYKGAHHAFFNDTRASYHPRAARDAFARVLAFFNRELGAE